MTSNVPYAEQSAAVSPLRDLLQPIADYKWYVIVFCASAIISSLALTYIYSEKYMAATTILFRPQEVTRLRQKESLAFGAPLPVAPFDLIYDNLQLLVKSEPVLFPVIRELGLDVEEEEEVYEGPAYIQMIKRAKTKLKKFRDDAWTILQHGRLVRDEPATAALKGVREHLSLVNHNSYVFYLSFVDKDPVRAARVVDAIAEKAVQWLLQDQQEPGTMRREQLEILKLAKEAEIERFQTEIERLLTTNGIASITLETEGSMNRYSELNLSRVRLASQIASTESKLAALEGYSKQGRDPSTALQPEDYRKINSERLFTEIELRSLRKEHASLNEAVAALERRMAALPAIQHRYDTLTQDLKTAQRDLVQISDPYHEAEVQATDNLSEVVIAHKARVPSIPVSPIKVYHVGLAGGLALCLSIGMAYFLAFVRSDQVAQMVSRAVSNVVGMWDGVERRRQRERRNTDQIVHTGPERRGMGDRREA